MDRRLTAREREIVHLIYLARGTREIAAILGIGGRTVTTHLQNIFCKLGITNRIDLAIWAMGELERQDRLSDTANIGQSRRMAARWRTIARRDPLHRQETAKIAAKAS
jgi:DNA-binding CsgD family transcriptional regulator